MVVCDVGLLQRSRARGVPRPAKKAKILTLEEWMRINNHLAKSNDIEEPKGDTKSRRTGASSSSAEVTSGDGAGAGAVGKNLEMKGNKNREEIIRKARDILFQNKDYVRRICHGLKLSSVLHERNGQIDFNRRIERQRKASERERIVKLNEEMINYREEMKRSFLRDAEKAKSFRNALDEQLAEKIEKLREGRTEKASERDYFVKIGREEEEAAEEERLADLRKKQKFREDFLRCWKAENEIRERLKAKDLEEEEMNKIYRDVAWEMNAKRRREESSRFGARGFGGGAVEEPESIGNRSDRARKLGELLEARKIMKRALVDDLLKSREMYEREFGKERENYKRDRRMSAARRKKKAEADEMRKEKEREERLKAMRNVMKFNLIQSMEKEEEMKKEKELDVFYAPDFSRENKLINVYCDGVVRLMEKVKRPLFPILTSVNEIKKEFGLERKTNEKFLKSNVPIGK